MQSNFSAILVEGQRAQNPVSVFLDWANFPALEHGPSLETRSWRLQVALKTCDFQGFRSAPQGGVPAGRRRMRNPWQPEAILDG